MSTLAHPLLSLRAPGLYTETSGTPASDGVHAFPKLQPVPFSGPHVRKAGIPHGTGQMGRWSSGWTGNCQFAQAPFHKGAPAPPPSPGSPNVV